MSLKQKRIKNNKIYQHILKNKEQNLDINLI